MGKVELSDPPAKTRLSPATSSAWKTGMRLSPILSVIALARELAASAEGLTIDEMANSVNASIRSAERMRDAVEAAFGTLDRIEVGRKIQLRLAPRSLGNFAAAPTAEELTELENAARTPDGFRANETISLDYVRFERRRSDAYKLNVTV